MSAIDALERIKQQAPQPDQPQRQPTADVFAMFMGKDVEVNYTHGTVPCVQKGQIISFSDRFVVVRSTLPGGLRHHFISMSAGVIIEEIPDGS